MNIRLLTLLIIISNVSLLWGEVPSIIIFYTAITVMLAFVFKNPKLQMIFKVLLLIGSYFLLKSAFPKVTQAESAISFVFILAGLKFWELDSENDHFNMFLILALSEAGIYLLNPSFIIFLFGLTKMIYYFYYILTIRQHKLAQINFRRLILLITPSIIFALVLFYTFPRFTQGFLNTNNSAVLFSGNRADLNFKELGPLNLSSNKVFKVYGLNEKLKDPASTYWRQMVLWDYHLSEWRSGNLNLKKKKKTTLEQNDLKGQALEYQIETSSIPVDYLPFLDLSKPRFNVFDINQSYFEFLDNSYKLKSPKRNGLSYGVSSTNLKNDQMTVLMMKKSTRLKSTQKDEVFNLYFKDDDLILTDQEKLSRLNKVFSARSFQYSLTPPNYNSLETYLLTGKEGYCSHFAAGYAYLSRLIGLPSRIVTGFLGGEINPYDDSLIIRELDAHAWVEVYLKNTGWVRVDPTEMVFPDRLRISNATIANTLNPTFFQDRFGYLKTISLWGDAFNSKFDAVLFNLDSDRQSRLFSFFFRNKISIGWMFILILTLGMGVFYLLPSLFNHHSSNYAQKRYHRFLKKIKKHGLVKSPHETASQFSERASHALPELKDYIALETNEYLKMTYESPSKLGK